MKKILLAAILLAIIFWPKEEAPAETITRTVEVGDTVYTIAAQLNTFYLAFGNAISNVMTPRVHRLVAEGQPMRTLDALFTRVGRLKFILLGGILLGFVAKMQMPFKLPAGLVAIVLGTALGWLSGYMAPAALTGTAVVTALGSDIVNVTGTGIGQFVGEFFGQRRIVVGDHDRRPAALGDIEHTYLDLGDQS